MVQWVKDLVFMWGLGSCCGMGSVPGTGTSTCQKHGPRKEKNDIIVASWGSIDYWKIFFFCYRQCLCCFKEYKHLEIFNQVVCALINLVIAQVQVLRDQLCKHCTTINIDSTWQDESNQAEEQLNIERECNEGSTERQKSVEKKSNSTKICNLTEEESSKGSDPFSLWSTDEKEKLLLCVAKIFQIQFPLYTAYKHNTHPTIEVCKNRYCKI